MLRTLFVACGIALYTLVVGVPLLIYTAISKKPDAIYWAGIKGVMFFVRIVGVKVKVSGLERIPSGPVLFVANHTSSADAPAVVGAIPRRISILLKKSLFKVPVVGQAFHSANFIPVDRSKHESAIASLDKATEALKSGHSFLIYPEGTRSPDGRLQEFRKGAAVMAIKAGVPVVPMICAGAQKVMEKRSLVIRPGTIYVEFLQAIDSKEFAFEERDSLNQQIHDAIAAALPPDQKPLNFPGAA